MAQRMGVFRKKGGRGHTQFTAVACTCGDSGDIVPPLPQMFRMVDAFHAASPSHKIRRGGVARYFPNCTLYLVPCKGLFQIC